jgi:hypothetical protein
MPRCRVEVDGEDAMSHVLQFKPRPYQTAQSTIDAFWYLVQLDDPERLKAWMADHPKDAPTLIKLLESKR